MPMAPRALSRLLLAASVAASAQVQTPQPEKPPPAPTKASPPAKKDRSAPDTTNPDKSAPAAESNGTVASAAGDPASDDPNFSSSRETIIDLSPPKDDRKDHPGSASAVDDATEADTGVQEFHQWNPMKALKDVEVGDYYFKRKNYKAALERYKEALEYKQGDAVATFRLAKCQEQMGDRDAALENYAAYLKILPHGPFAQEAGDAIEDLKAEASKK